MKEGEITKRKKHQGLIELVMENMGNMVTLLSLNVVL